MSVIAIIDHLYQRKQNNVRRLYPTAANSSQKNQTPQILLLVIVNQNVSNRTIFGFPPLTLTFVILIGYGTALV